MNMFISCKENLLRSSNGCLLKKKIGWIRKSAFSEHTHEKLISGQNLTLMFFQSREQILICKLIKSRSHFFLGRLARQLISCSRFGRI